MIALWEDLFAKFLHKCLSLAMYLKVQLNFLDKPLFWSLQITKSSSQFFR